VLRCALLKQQRQLSYEELAFHLEDSASFRALCPAAAGLVAEEIGAAPDGSVRSGQRAGRRSIGRCWAAPSTTGWKAAPRCGSTARSPRR
jgi:hypothetical protein